MSEEQETPNSEVAKPSGGARNLIIVILVIVVGVWLFSVLRNSAQRQINETLNSTSCTSGGYRRSAIVLMNELKRITDQVDIRDAQSRADSEADITALLSRINQLDCRDAFPLKHETLEFAARHFNDALKAMDANNFDGAAESLDKAALNAERFNDWSVDMDN